MKKYDIGKISAERFFNIVDELNNSKNEEESNKILAKLKIKKRG
jgi:Ca2+-binding EF-hand superfamily protein